MDRSAVDPVHELTLVAFFIFGFAHTLFMHLQPGQKWGPLCQEPYNRLQSAVSSLSRGPVAPSDAIGKSDAALINMACMPDGTLLRPERPATELDMVFVTKSLGVEGPRGHVWSTEQVQ